MTKSTMTSKLSILFILLATNIVSAQTANLLQNPNADNGTQSWRAMGEATVEELGGNRSFVVRNGGSLYQDLTLPEGTTGQYAVFTGRGSSGRINADGSITGLPYLYGYMMAPLQTGPGSVLAHLQGQRMLGRAAGQNEWVKMWGIFRVPDGTGRIRFFLSQASQRGVEHNGSAARFDDVGLYIFATEEAARAFLGVTAQAQQSPQQATQSAQQQIEQKPPVVDKKAHEALVGRFKKKAGENSEVDFTKVRHAFYESSDYNPLTPMMTYRPLYGALDQKNYAEAIRIAQAVLAKNFVEVNAHMVAQIAYQETGDAERAEFHKQVAESLLNSIKSGGDGKSAATAFNVISINEEYGLLRSLGLRPIKQSLVEEKGHMFDALEVIDPRTNQHAVFYFNVDKPLKWTAREVKQ